MPRRGPRKPYGPARASYEERRKFLLIELRLMRLTNPSKRLVKHQQRLMRALRFARKEGIVRSLRSTSNPADLAPRDA